MPSSGQECDLCDIENLDKVDGTSMHLIAEQN